MPKSKGRRKQTAKFKRAVKLAAPIVQAALRPRVYPMIACPNYFGKIDVRQFHSINEATLECIQNGWEIPFIHYRTTDSVITRARNVAVAYFMETQCTDLVFVDADISWQMGMFGRLMSHQVELVAGAYRARGEPERYPIIPFKDELAIDQKNGLMAVEAAPTGFMRITRACAEKMLKAYGHRWYRDEGTAPGLKIPCLFDFDYVAHGQDEDPLIEDGVQWQGTDSPGGTYFSEDFVFCKRWNALGEKTWIDPNLVIHHSGEAVYTGCLINYLNHEFARMHPATRPPMTDIVGMALAMKEPASGQKEEAAA